MSDCALEITKMTGLFLAISLFWLFPTISHTLDIPLQSALLIKGEPVGLTRSSHREKRSETLNETVLCKEDEYKPKKANHCCNKCLAGFKVISDCFEEGMKSRCAPCQEGSFKKSPSGSKTCLLCTECLSQFGQITLHPCTKLNDTVCGCPAGHYKSNNERKFTCQQCSKCENGTQRYPCRSDHDTVCNCFHNFYLDSTGKCRSCNLCNQTDDCVNHCPLPPLPGPIIKPNPDIAPAIIPSVICVSLLALVIAIIVVSRQKFCSVLKRTSHLPTTNKSGSSQVSTPLMDKSMAKCKLDSLPGHAVYIVEDAGLQQQNKAQNSTLPLPDITLQTKTPCLNRPEVLYRIIECIPVGSWREFVRRLGVSNHVIETSEQDYRHYKEAQYEMLSFWVRNDGSSGATMNSLFRVLREMNLGGCVEKIEEGL